MLFFFKHGILMYVLDEHDCRWRGFGTSYDLTTQLRRCKRPYASSILELYCDSYLSVRDICAIYPDDTKSRRGRLGIVDEILRG